MKKEIKTKGGADLVVRPASLANAINLQNVVLKEISGTGLDIDLDLNKMLGGDVGKTLNELLPVFVNVCSSEAVQNALFDCLVQCTYNSEKITRDTFENFEVRGDFYEVLIECAKYNLAPFFKNLLSGLNEKLKAVTKDLKQK